MEESLNTLDQEATTFGGGETQYSSPAQGDYLQGGYPQGGYAQGYPQGGYQQPVAPPVKKSNTSLIVGILVGVVVMLLAFVVYFLISSSNKNAEEAERLMQAHIQDSINNAALQQQAAEAQAQAEAQAEAQAQAEAEAARARAEAEAVKYATASGTYTGKIGGSKFKIRLTQNGGELNGQDNWLNNSTWLDVYGSINGSSVNLEEQDEYGYPNASLSGTINGKYFKGTFYNYNTGKSFSFTLTR